MKLFLSVLVILLILGLGSELFHRVVASSVWHWRHGDSIVLADTEVSVPKPWFVDQAGNTVAELGRPHLPSLRHAAFESRATVSVLPEAVDLPFWEGQEHAFYDRAGATIMRRREIQLTPQYRIVCFEGELAREALKIKNSALVTANCQSNGRLSLSFTGSQNDLSEFYTIVGAIRVAN